MIAIFCTGPSMGVDVNGGYMLCEKVLHVFSYSILHIISCIFCII